MSLLDILLLAVGLSMDAFAVAVCKGLAIGSIRPRHAATVGAWFGFFQALMPTLGFLVGSVFARFVEAFAPWISFVLLALIGGNMVRESFGDDGDDTGASLGFRVMLAMAVATSIDALAVGVSFAVDGMTLLSVLASSLLIGCVTFAISAAGVWIGSVFGTKYKKGAERVGGVILILLGIKILLSGLGILPF